MLLGGESQVGTWAEEGEPAYPDRGRRRVEGLRPVTKVEIRVGSQSWGQRGQLGWGRQRRSDGGRAEAEEAPGAEQPGHYHPGCSEKGNAAGTKAFRNRSRK